MTSLTFAIMLLLRIAPGLGEESPYPADDGLPPATAAECRLLREECSAREGCLRDVCSYLERCSKRNDCRYPEYRCWDFLRHCVTGVPSKRSSITKNSFLFLKLHPLLNRAADPNLVNVPTRFRRIGVRLGSEFLGKRAVDAKRQWGSGIRRGRDPPGTELLGKRWSSVVVEKRNVEMLGKRSGEFLGKRDRGVVKRSGEFLGKRSGEFLGKRTGEFLGKKSGEFLGKRPAGAEKKPEQGDGKRSGEFLGKRTGEYPEKRTGEFLGKRGTELLGKRGFRYRDLEDWCGRFLARDPKLFLRCLMELSDGDREPGVLVQDRTK